MRKLLTFLIALAAIAFAQSADAATCFWVGTGGAPGGGTAQWHGHYQRKNAIRPFTISKNTTTKVRKKGGPSGIA